MVKTKQVKVMSVKLDANSTNIFEDMEVVKRAATREVSLGGYTDPTYMIESTIEPYDGDPSDPVITVYGHRPLTPEELELDLREESLYKEAKKLGITPYEMKQLQNLRDKGVV